MLVAFGVAALFFGPPSVYGSLAGAATVGAVVLLWLPRSRAFFRQAKADRTAHKLKQLY